MDGAHLVAVSDGAGDSSTNSSTSPVVAGEDKKLELTTSTNEPTASTNELTASTNEPTASTKEPTTSTKESTASTKEPTASTKCAGLDGICAATATGAAPTKKTSNARSTKPKIKRPMNAFMVWSSHERKRLAEKEPSLHNTQLSVRLGQIWKGMSEKEKAPFRQEALKLKQKLMEEHPDYKYRPRRRKLDSHLKATDCFFAAPAPINSLPYHELLPGTPMYQSQTPVQTTYPHQVYDGHQGYPFSPVYVNAPPYYLMDPHLPGNDASGIKSLPSISVTQNGLETPPISPSPYVTSTPVHTYAIPPAPTATQVSLFRMMRFPFFVLFAGTIFHCLGSNFLLSS